MAVTVFQKKNKTEQALNALFELADSDHSGHVDPSELAGILRALGWKSIKLTGATKLARTIGARDDGLGHLYLNEQQFVHAMISGRVDKALGAMKIRKRSIFPTRKNSKQGSSSRSSSSIVVVGDATQETKDTEEQISLSNVDKLVKWTLRSALVSNALSGATQLLLLAHTPVSRKVFQYFHCHEIAGVKFLRADYDIDCQSDEYYSFMPFVVVVLIFYTIALPAVISWYLWKHRKDLYSTKTYQRIGWLYDPFVRGAEFWQVHDVLMKIMLTVSVDGW